MPVTPRTGHSGKGPDKSDQRLPPDLRRILLIVVGAVALVELLMWLGVGSGWFHR